ncbi:hypothetical protein TNCT_74471 [Trichonephila clavata]|uniref:Uncharacterized protein n=1 Tax=Trichonephila clavata TaxID=2740835 RepID=A0A8X6FTM1_TRICU|nr:hypothetical protein TNCT_74471 [Trichonephila clavata]
MFDYEDNHQRLMYCFEVERKQTPGQSFQRFDWGNEIGYSTAPISTDIKDKNPSKQQHLAAICPIMDGTKGHQGQQSPWPPPQCYST